MRQLLILGFYCEVYRREPLCRVYVNDVLLDEFNIPHTPKDVLDYNYKNFLLDPKYSRADLNFIDSQLNPLFYKLIEFNEFNGKLLDLRIEILNNDNNYTNGFLTKYTRIMLDRCYLLPIKILDNVDSLIDRWKFNPHNWYKFHGLTKPVTYLYTKQRQIILNLVTSASEKEAIKLHFLTNTQTANKTNYVLKWEWWIGESVHFHLSLKKKLGFWRHINDNRTGYQIFTYINFIKDLYDKYKQYEDTRSTDQ